MEDPITSDRVRVIDVDATEDVRERVDKSGGRESRGSGRYTGRLAIAKLFLASPSTFFWVAATAGTHTAAVWVNGRCDRFTGPADLGRRALVFATVEDSAFSSCCLLSYFARRMESASCWLRSSVSSADDPIGGDVEGGSVYASRTGEYAAVQSFPLLTVSPSGVFF